MNKGKYRPAIFALCLVGLPPMVAAKPSSLEEADKLSQYAASLKELELRDTRRAATTEIGLANSWITQANTQLDKRSKRHSLRRLILQVETMKQLIDALIIQAELNELSDAAIQKADQIEEELRTTSAKLKETIARQEKFEKEIGE